MHESIGAANQNRGKTHQSTHQVANLKQPQHRTINVPFETRLFHAFNRSTALESLILQDRFQATIVVTNPHVTQMMYRPLSVTNCSVALSEALVSQITQYNTTHVASPIQFYPQNVLNVLKGLIISKTTCLNINKAEKRVTLSLIFSSTDTCQQSRELLDLVGIKTNPSVPTRSPPYSYGNIFIPSHITNDEIDSFISEYGISSLQIARVMYPAPSNHIPQNRCYFRCFVTQREALRKIPALPGTPSSSIPEWKFFDRTLMVCTHCHTATRHTANYCPSKHTINKAAAEHMGRAHSCIRCGSFDHHEPQCPNRNDPGCPLCRTKDSTVDNLPSHTIRDCSLFKQTITTVSAAEPEPATAPLQKPRTTKNAWQKPLHFNDSGPRASPPTSASKVQIPNINSNDATTLNDLLKMIIQIQQQQQQQQQLFADLVKQLPTMIQQALSQMRILHPTPESGSIHVTPALSHNLTPSISTERQRPNTQARRASQPNLTTYVQRMQAIPSQANQTTPTTVPTTTTNTSVEKSPQTSPRRTPGYDTVQNTHRDQYKPLKVLDEKTVLNEHGNETLQFLVKWNTIHQDNTSWVNSDDSVIVNSGLNLKWATQKNKQKQKQQQLQTKQNEQTISIGNSFNALADEPLEEKHNHETAGRPGTEEEIRQDQENATTQTQVELTQYHAPNPPPRNAP